MSEEDESASRMRMIGMAIGAAVAVASGAAGFLQLRGVFSGPTTSATLSGPEMLRNLYTKMESMEELAAENRHRIEALERPGGTTPMARETRERFEAIDRVITDMQRQMTANTERLDRILLDRGQKGRP